MNNFKIGTGDLSQIFEIISTLVDEIKIVMDKDGWKMKCVDPAHVAMLSVEVDKKIFDEYLFKGDEIELGVDVDKLRDLLKLNKDSVFEGQLVDSKLGSGFDILARIGKLKRLLVGVGTGGYSNAKLPNLDLPLKREVKTNDLLLAIKNAERVSDHIAFIADEKGLKLRADGDMEYVEFPLNNEGTEEPRRSLFSIDYLLSIVKANPTEKTDITMGTDLPVDFNFDLDNEIKVRYILAPRMESE